MDIHIRYTKNGRVMRQSLTKTFGTYAEYATLKGRLIRWYTEADRILLTEKERKSLVTIRDDVYNIKGLSPPPSHICVFGGGS